jgi:hypothetical protein
MGIFASQIAAQKEMDMTNVARIIFSKRFLLASVVSTGLAAAENLARARCQSSVINDEIVCQAPTSTRGADQICMPEKSKTATHGTGGFM